MSHKSIAIALPLEEKHLIPLHAWGERFDWSHIIEVHFIHVVKKNIAPLEFGMVEMPDEKAFQEMIPSMEKFLKEESQKILPKTYGGNVRLHLSRDFNPEEDIMAMLKKLNVTLLVVSTHGKHGIEGFFHSSFTEQMIKNAPCDVYVVRPV